MTDPRRTLASPLLTLGLGVVLVAFAGVAVAVSLGPGLRPDRVADGSPTPGALGSPTPLPSPSPSPILTFGYPTPSPEPTFMTYVVRVGDSLTTIARAYGTSARSLAWWNRGTYPSLDPESPGYDPNSIHTGWRLVLIPGETVDEENPPSPSPAPPTPTPATSPAAPSGPTAEPTLG